MYLHITVLILAALALALGWHFRLACLIFLLGFTWLELIDKTPYFNHYYALILFAFLLLWMPLDRRQGSNFKSLSHWRIPVWPLRHWLYPGNVLWTEEGFRFSWYVMLIEKTGLVQYRLYAPRSDRHWEVQPDMIQLPTTWGSSGRTKAIPKSRSMPRPMRRSMAVPVNI